jgi:hypothetical protein
MPMASPISIDSQDVLLAIDLQADFMPGGALAAAEAMRSSRLSIYWRADSSMWS